MFTEKHREKAIMLEKVAACGLARHFAEQNEAYIEQAKNIETVEDVTKSFENIMQSQKNVKLLKDIEEGKYRLIFMAFAAESDRIAEEFIKEAKEESDNGESADA